MLFMLFGALTKCEKPSSNILGYFNPLLTAEVSLFVTVTAK